MSIGKMVARVRNSGAITNTILLWNSDNNTKSDWKKNNKTKQNGQQKAIKRKSKT